MVKVLVCGGRNFGYIPTEEKYKHRDFDLTNRAIDAVKEFSPTVIIEGNATGGDEIGVLTSEVMDIPLKTFPASWSEYGFSAGPMRNKQMLEEGKPDIVVAFPGGKGTEHMKRISRRAGVPVHEVNL